MESAIASHLKCPRTQAKRVADDYAPPYPAWVARADVSLQQVVMGYFGIQWRNPTERDRAYSELSQVESHFESPNGPGHHDRARYVDAAGYETLVAIAYWSDPKTYTQWKNAQIVADWWSSEERDMGDVGYFREVLSPPVARFETLFSTPDRLEGIGTVMGDPSAGDVREHAYWGSMRERLPIAQTNALVSSGKLLANAPAPNGRRVHVRGHDNVAIIRSGQEWAETVDTERELYVGRMEPILRAGMEFLSNAGTEIGCYLNRYMQHVDRQGQVMEKTFGLSYWRSLGDLESWAEHHPTHLHIFGTFLQIVQELQSPLALRLYHEVSVLSADEQEYEYINCHGRTGMLNACAQGR